MNIEINATTLLIIVHEIDMRSPSYPNDPINRAASMAFYFLLCDS